MRRLTYAPKAWVYVRSRNNGGKVFDLSDYVTGGSIQRLVNQPSKATIVLRNAFFQFTAANQVSFFLPMDGITIWLQRLKNKPIQVFTGYLDSVPYYQMYPGNCQLTATCTLKRLDHVYFDPGTMAMRDFFVANGWTVSADGTQVFNLGSSQVLTPDQQPATQTTGPGQNLQNPSNDSGLGKIIAPFLTEVCGWPADQIHISNLPTDLPQRAAKLYNTVAAEQQTMLDALETVLKNMMSVQAGTSTTSNPVQLDIVNTIYKSASTANEPPIVMVIAAMVLSGLDSSYEGQDGSAGLYATPNSSITVDSFGDSSQPLLTSPLVSPTATVYDGYTADQILDPATATAAFAMRLQKVDPDKTYMKAANNGDVVSIAEWIAKAQGVDLSTISNGVNNAYPSAQSFLAASTSAVVNPNDPLLTGVAADLLPDGLKWSSPSLFTATSFNDQNIYQQYYTGANDSLAPYVYVAHKSGLALAKQPTVIAGRKDIVVLMDPSPSTPGTSSISQFFDWAKTQDGADIVRYVPTSASTATIPAGSEWHNGVQVTSGTTQTNWPNGYVYVQVSKSAPYPIWTGNPSLASNQASATPSDSSATPSTPSTGQQPLTFEDIATLGFQTAFYAQAQFPADTILSQVLTGEKALMNDIPVSNGVSQFCSGSMRNYMSLGDGSFCAFYPDYFGASGRDPYWAITDLEITNMGIQLSDEALATHVYVTGGLASPGSITEMLDAVSTPGVVTIDHVFGDGNFISTDVPGETGGDVLSREAQAFQFLQFYGARPYSYDQPLIRSQYFEFLYAWQLFMWLWAMQFQTSVQFTFQPELMAGGRIAFPDHSLEMYIESVTHTWDYESGFTTSAVLTAPATTDKTKFPGFALAGNNLSGFGAV